MAVSQAHRDYLLAQAISDTYIGAVCDTEPDGMVFNFVGPAPAGWRSRSAWTCGDGPRGPPITGGL